MKKSFTIIIAFLLQVITSFSQGYTNPVISGFYPDPSICRKGDDYYLVNSSFEYFPGVPVFHSKDLVNWKQISYCLTRESQLYLHGSKTSGGIFAPTIRYHNGTFYMVTTNISDKRGRINFYVTTKDPAGEWSDPIIVDQNGIDPSLFFDDDGKVYFTSTAKDGIQQCQIDITTGKKLTESKFIWGGTGGYAPEGPHLYKLNGWYYLMIAEGGTEYAHSETIARGNSPWGPFEAYAKNPILSHWNKYGGSSPIQGVGHADLIQAHDSSWWAVLLGFRPIDRKRHIIGRETFVAPVSWTEDKWPVINKNGIVNIEMNVPTLPLHPWSVQATRDDFNTNKLGLCWSYLRNPVVENYSLNERKGWLRLKGSENNLFEIASPTFLCRRQQHFDFKATTLMEYNPLNENEEAGMAMFMNNKHFYNIAIKKSGEQRELSVNYNIGSIKAQPIKVTLKQGDVKLRISGDKSFYTFWYAQGNDTFTQLAKVETKYLSKEIAGGFSGVFIGLYTTTNGKNASAPADFDWFDYEHKD